MKRSLRGRQLFDYSYDPTTTTRYIYRYSISLAASQIRHHKEDEFLHAGFPIYGILGGLMVGFACEKGGEPPPAGLQVDTYSTETWDNICIIKQKK